MKAALERVKERLLHFYRLAESFIFSRFDDKNAKSMILVWKNED